MNIEERKALISLGFELGREVSEFDMRKMDLLNLPGEIPLGLALGQACDDDEAPIVRGILEPQRAGVV